MQSTGIVSEDVEASSSSQLSSEENAPMLMLPVTKLVKGSHAVRNMFPRRSIPDQFNPVTVDFQTFDDLPLLLYGVPYDEHKLFTDALRSYKKTYGMEIGLREYSNRDMAVLDTRHNGRALTTITAMEFDVDKDAKWWVDRGEKVRRRRSFLRTRAADSAVLVLSESSLKLAAALLEKSKGACVCFLSWKDAAMRAAEA
ncbi:hypothetical protein OH76DRAFT_1416577 [Lentinus brumalis]|uniref:Uncharacterized protein n=1 Tax=Lentinus brumalis TaxID=2498619 RepID=A0A371DIN1_9APHY|nr:hypothetical protein OH76DRAFT_1416577 [Polyporus brumalis]